MVSEQIGRFIAWLRDGLARGLLRVGVRPNHITVLGTVITVGAGVAIAAGPRWWPLAGGFILASGACDVLDGALANLGDLKTHFGAMLDSICDRVSDAALFFGAAFFYVMRPDGPNVTLALAACAGLVWAYLTSYARSRAAPLGGDCDGGFWQRGERVVTMLLGVLFGHLSTAVWVLAVWPVATVAHRLWWIGRAAKLVEAGKDPADEPIEPRGGLGVVLWRYPRGSLPFDVHAGLVIALLVFWSAPETDWLGAWLASP